MRGVEPDPPARARHVAPQARLDPPQPAAPAKHPFPLRHCQVLSETQDMERKCSREYIAYEKAKKRSADARAKNPGKKF